MEDAVSLFKFHNSKTVELFLIMELELCFEYECMVVTSFTLLAC
jgi:hypothetical protein